MKLDSNTFPKKMNITEKKAQVRLEGNKKVAVNPLYFLVARLFDIGETYTVDEVFHAVNEEGVWKICKDNLLASN